MYVVAGVHTVVDGVAVAADAAARAAYYAPLGEGPPTFEALSKLISSTHRQKPRYQPSLHVYPWVDLHPDLKLRSLYSGKTFDPETLIREDLRIEALWPPPASAEGLPQPAERNDRSLTLRIELAGRVVLLPGDLEAAGEAQLLAAGAPLSADVLKLARAMFFHEIGGASPLKDAQIAEGVKREREKSFPT